MKDNIMMLEEHMIILRSMIQNLSYQLDVFEEELEKLKGDRNER